MASAAPLLDPLQLKRQTGGDPAFQVEVLSLFIAEAERLVRQIEEASNAPLRKDRLRAMEGLARNIGAVRLAQTARALEPEMASEEPNLEPLHAALAETLTYVRSGGG
jgi:HPt (histidine-containing phosphotransfer) domain-containing protein